MTFTQKVKKSQYGFLKGRNDLAKVIEENRLQLCMVRTGNGRFITPAQNVQHYIDIIKNEGSDYLRDVSVYYG
jgi:hypothetical protein